MAGFAEVALPLPLRREFIYRIPPDLGPRVSPGVRVRVMLGHQRQVGVVTALMAECALPAGRLRPLLAVVDHAPVVPAEIMALCRRIAERTLCSLGEALDAAIPAPLKHRPSRTVPFAILRKQGDELTLALVELEGRRPLAKQARVLRALAEAGGEMRVHDLVRRAMVTKAPLENLVVKGLVELVRRPAPPGAEILGDLGSVGPVPRLTAEQEECVAALAASIRSERYGAFLLHGVTGSGKTEVYLQAMAAALACGRTAVVLVPEIALTPQTVARFRARCPQVAVLHSSLTEVQRADQWRALLEGRALVAIGPRSALFAPVARLGLIVVDEEHESSFKQGNVPRYHAREMALERARLAGATVVLGSATPSLEAWQAAREGELRLLTLRRRVGGSALPHLEVVDMRGERKGPGGYAFLSEPLASAMRDRLRQGEQVILFLNRRGFAPVLTCRRCGVSVRCQECSVPLTFHRGRGFLVCHYCAHETRPPAECPECAHSGLYFLGFGTERVEAEVRRLFPEYPVERMDSDAMVRREALEEVLRRFRAGEIRILVGTQMIAKGLDFPKVTVVGVISADTSLHLPDFRAGERTFQLISQVAGRAGRGDSPGVVVVQTCIPGNPAIQAAVRHDFAAYAEAELATRKAAGYPPFLRLGRVVVEGEDPKRVEAGARALGGALRENAREELFSVLGPVAAPLARLRGRHRWHLMLKIPKSAPDAALAAALEPALARAPAGVKFLLDLDPAAVL